MSSPADIVFLSYIPVYGLSPAAESVLHFWRPFLELIDNIPHFGQSFLLIGVMESNTSTTSEKAVSASRQRHWRPLIVSEFPPRSFSICEVLLIISFVVSLSLNLLQDNFLL
jgi:hypothetical protein